jgi:Fe-S-cluster containining protein
VEIYIDHDRQWQILFKTPCTKLLDNGMCAVYETRPQICRDYKADACSRVGKDYIELFKTPAELDLYFESRKSATAKKTAPKTAGKTSKKAAKKAIKKPAKKAAKKSTKKAAR